MDNIVTFFKLLFFLNTSLLTPVPIEIGGEWVTIKPGEPLEAITGGAAIYIDITNYVKPMDFEEVSKIFPDGSVEGKLITNNGKEVLLSSVGSSHSNESVQLIVAGKGPVHTNVEYKEVMLKSLVPIKSTNVYWRNGKL